MSYVDFLLTLTASSHSVCQYKHPNKYICSVQGCHHSTCSPNGDDCHSERQCSADYRPLCASNLQEYSNECEMTKYACQLHLRLTKLHDGPCDAYEQQRQLEGNYQASSTSDLHRRSLHHDDCDGSPSSGTNKRRKENRFSLSANLH